MADPKLSIILSCRDKWPLLQDAVRSVFLQTFSDWELIICDDDSRDARVQTYLRSISKSPGVQVFWGQPVNEEFRKNHKMNAVRINAGIELARGIYITYLCDDDVWYPERCERMVRVLDKNRRVGMVVDLVEWQMADGEMKAQDAVRYQYKQPYAAGHLELLKAISPSNFICHDCAMHRFPRKCQRWPTDMGSPPVDWRFWLTLHDDGIKIKKLDEVRARAVFPGTWRSGVTVGQILPNRQELPRSEKMVNKARAKKKRIKAEAAEKQRLAKSGKLKYAINTSGKVLQGTDQRTNKFWRIKPGERVPAEQVAVLTPDGNVQKLLPGFSWDTKLKQEKVKDIMKKPAREKKYDFEKVTRAKTARQKIEKTAAAVEVADEEPEEKKPFEEVEIPKSDIDVRICEHEGCDAVLGKKNKSGFCVRHYRLYR